MPSGIPGRVDRGSEKDAPLRIDPAPAPGHVAITANDTLRFGFFRAGANEVTDVGQPIQVHPVRAGSARGFFGRAKQYFWRAQFIGAQAEVIRPVKRVETATIRGGKLPRILVSVVQSPDSEAQTHLAERAETRRPFRLGLGMAQRGQKQPGQDRDNCDHHQQFNQSERFLQYRPSHKFTLPRPGLRKPVQCHSEWVNLPTNSERVHGRPYSLSKYRAMCRTFAPQ